MSWQQQDINMEDCDDPSQISVSSRIYVSKKANHKDTHLNSGSLLPEDCEDKQLASTNYDSELPQLPSIGRGSKHQPTLEPFEQRNTQSTPLDDLEEQEAKRRQTIRSNLEQLMRQVRMLQKREEETHKHFVAATKLLKQQLRTRMNRNRNIKAQIESMRRDLNDKRIEVKNLISYHKNHHPKQMEYPAPVQHKPMDTLKQYQSQRYLNSQQKASVRQTMTSNEEKKNRIVSGKRIFVRDKSDSGKQFKNY